MIRTGKRRIIDLAREYSRVLILVGVIFAGVLLSLQFDLEQRFSFERMQDLIRSKGACVLAGVSAHNPDCIKKVADEGWDVDLFMTWFYYLTRTPEELEEMPPVVTLQIGYPFFASDPMAMTQVIRQLDQPCLGFKILAAGRMCGRNHKVEAAFRFAVKHIKPTDGVIVGMYPRHTDQIRQNAQYTRQFGNLR